MAMQLLQRKVYLDEERSTSILVSEAGWDYSFRFAEIEKEVAPLLDDPNHNEAFKFFCRNYYPLLASCVVEGTVPSPQEAFGLPRDILDDWYYSIWKLNPDIISEKFSLKEQCEEVEFRDGTKITVYKASGVPSFLLKLIELEDDANRHPLQDDPQGQMFISLFYPKMAAACNGSSNVPDARTVRSWPRGEIAKWMDASRRLNPEWFLVTEEEQKAEAKERTKKVRKR